MKLSLGSRALSSHALSCVRTDFICKASSPHYYSSSSSNSARSHAWICSLRSMWIWTFTTGAASLQCCTWLQVVHIHYTLPKKGMQSREERSTNSEKTLWNRSKAVKTFWGKMGLLHFWMFFNLIYHNFSIQSKDCHMSLPTWIQTCHIGLLTSTN